MKWRSPPYVVPDSECPYITPTLDVTESEYFKDTNEKTNTDWTDPTKKLYQPIKHHDTHTHNLPTLYSTTTALPSTALLSACSSLPPLLFLVRLARQRRQVPIITIVQFYPIPTRLRRWVFLVYYSPSENIAVTLVWGDGGKVLVEAGKNDEAAAEETAGNFGRADRW